MKKLELPEQRSEAWYEMRKTKLTASSLASAIDHCHFKSRDELILDKIITNTKGLKKVNGFSRRKRKLIRKSALNLELRFS